MTRRGTMDVAFRIKDYVTSMMREAGPSPFTPIVASVALLEQVRSITGKFDLVVAGDAKP
jgi:hypothetical protein